MFQRRSWIALVALTLLAANLSSCGGARQSAPAERTAQSTRPTAPDAAPAPEARRPPYPITLQDGAGRSVTLQAEPRRIVSLAPSNTELVFALGKGGSLVGRTEYCDYPAEAKTVESVGSLLKPNYEKIVSLKPDLVLMMSGNAKERDQLVGEYRLNVFVVGPEDLEQVYAGIRNLGVALNASEKAGSLVAQMQEQVAEVTGKVSQVTGRPKVFYEVWHEPLQTAGPKTFIDDLIRLAGGLNVAADARQQWPAISLEKLAESNPDIILVGSAQPPEAVKARKGWENFRAVRENRVFVVEDVNLVVRPGPRLASGLAWIARTIHPELYR